MEFEDVFELLCEAAHKAHREPGHRTGEKATAIGLAGQDENWFQPIIVQVLKAGPFVDAVREYAPYPGMPKRGRGKKNDFTISFNDGRPDLFIELKTPFVIEKGLRWNKAHLKDSLPAAAIKLKDADPPCGLLVAGSSPEEEKETDELVRKYCTPPGVSWSKEYGSPIAHVDLGYFKKHRFVLSKLYLFVKLGE